MAEGARPVGRETHTDGKEGWENDGTTKHRRKPRARRAVTRVPALFYAQGQPRLRAAAPGGLRLTRRNPLQDEFFILYSPKTAVMEE